MSCMHVKNRTTKMDPKSRISICFLRKFMLVCAFYKLEYLPYLAVMLPKLFLCKIVYLVLGLIKTKLLNIIAPQLVVL
jgi:hypothetical protein